LRCSTSDPPPTRVLSTSESRPHRPALFPTRTKLSLCGKTRAGQTGPIPCQAWLWSWLYPRKTSQDPATTTALARIFFWPHVPVSPSHQLFLRKSLERPDFALGNRPRISFEFANTWIIRVFVIQIRGGPSPTYRGKFNLRLPSSLNHRWARTAARGGGSLNQCINAAPAGAAAYPQTVR
jgi:hypothetical protein